MRKQLILCFVGTLTILASCKKKDDPAPSAPIGNAKVSGCLAASYENSYKAGSETISLSSLQYQYNNSGQLVQGTTKDVTGKTYAISKLVYNGNTVTSTTYDATGTVVLSSTIATINSDGTIAKSTSRQTKDNAVITDTVTYAYENGYLVSVTRKGKDASDKYTTTYTIVLTNIWNGGNLIKSQSTRNASNYSSVSNTTYKNSNTDTFEFTYSNTDNLYDFNFGMQGKISSKLAQKRTHTYSYTSYDDNGIPSTSTTPGQEATYKYEINAKGFVTKQTSTSESSESYITYTYQCD